MDWLINYQGFIELVSSTLSKDVTQFGIAFTLAALIHAGRVKKEIRMNFSGLKDVMKDFVSALRQDLEIQAKRISNLEEEVRIMNKKQNTEG